MAYCTQSDLVDRFGLEEVTEASDRLQVGAIDKGVLSDAIADGDATINGYLRGIYQIPVEGSPELTRIACDLTRFYLWGIHPPEHVEERYKAAIAYLKDVAKGLVTLDATLAETEASGPSAPVVKAPDQVFTTDQLNKITLT